MFFKFWWYSSYSVTKYFCNILQLGQIWCNLNNRSSCREFAFRTQISDCLLEMTETPLFTTMPICFARLSFVLMAPCLRYVGKYYRLTRTLFSTSMVALVDARATFYGILFLERQDIIFGLSKVIEKRVKKILDISILWLRVIWLYSNK
jgi:hypothetical protein